MKILSCLTLLCLMVKIESVLNTQIMIIQPFEIWVEIVHITISELLNFFSTPEEVENINF